MKSYEYHWITYKILKSENWCSSHFWDSEAPVFGTPKIITSTLPWGSPKNDAQGDAQKHPWATDAGCHGGGERGRFRLSLTFKIGKPWLDQLNGDIWRHIYIYIYGPKMMPKNVDWTCRSPSVVLLLKASQIKLGKPHSTAVLLTGSTKTWNASFTAVGKWVCLTISLIISLDKNCGHPAFSCIFRHTKAVKIQ